MAHLTENLSLLITGANGYSGARIYQECRNDPRFTSEKVLGTYRAEKLFPELLQMDIANPDSIKQVVKEVSPRWIIHVAALPNQARCAEDSNYATKVNLEGTALLVAAANESGSKILFISSESAYEDTLYGTLKKRGEEIIRKATHGYCILQPAMIFGGSPNTVNDRPYNRLLRTIEKGKGSYDEDLIIYSTWLGHLSEVIRECVIRNITGVTIPVITAHPISRYQIAKDILAPFGTEISPEHSGNHKGPPPLSEEQLKTLGLPRYDYETIIGRIQEETKGIVGQG